jgi:hypothetical protein
VENEDLLTVPQTAAELGVTRSAVHIALAEGRLPFVVKYQQKLVSRPDLDAYKQRTQPEGVKRVGRPKKGQKEATS